MIDALVWICIKDRRVLCTRTGGKDVFYMPGGKREDGESDWDGLFREIQEELNVALIRETLAEVTVVQELAHGYSEPTQVRMKCFQANYIGEITPSSEIKEIAWFSYKDLKKCTAAARKVIEYLRGRNLID